MNFPRIDFFTFFFVVLPILCLWYLPLISLCKRRDLDIHVKINWIVTILVLGLIGSVIYLLFGPSRPYESEYDPDVEPYEPGGKTWNPILGTNDFQQGVGLNPNRKSFQDSQAERHQKDFPV
ncbi:MAG: PLDc_N domain-containing protein [Verrucomicrobia bacterium]|nr:PLDc_N domain-containing protein [Verrucomicrobiota bacterium]MCH8514408.1 PLD nuclease N-terminal domain-containing protein [Kiritimatiellia bacterium]